MVGSVSGAEDLQSGGQRPDCSPDGRTVAFARGPQFFTIAVSGRGLQQITHGTRVLSGPTFAPNGKELALTVGRLRLTCDASGDASGIES